MSVKEIQQAIALLPPGELADLLEWIEQFEADAWDEQLRRDVRTGRFDSIRKQIQAQKEGGECKPL